MDKLESKLENLRAEMLPEWELRFVKTQSPGEWERGVTNETAVKVFGKWTAFPWSGSHIQTHSMVSNELLLHADTTVIAKTLRERFLEQMTKLLRQNPRIPFGPMLPSMFVSPLEHEALSRPEATKPPSCQS